MSSASTPTSQFSFRRSDYTSQPRQSYYRSNNPSRYASRGRSNRSGWQSSAYGSYRPSYQPCIGPNSTEAKVAEETLAYNEEEEEFSAGETQVYQPQLAYAQEIDPVVTLERICNWLANILRKPDLARKLAGARLELGMDENGENRATFWPAGDRIDPRSFSLGDKSLLRMAFSTEVRRGYQLQLAKGQEVVPLE